MYEKVLCFCSLGRYAQQRATALEFSFVYNDTISFTDIPGLTVGDAAQITVVLDNGDSSLNSQTWTTASHLKQVIFDFGNGTLQTTFKEPWGGGLDSTAGNFATNASGMLTSVMTRWFDVSVGTDDTDFTTNGATPGSWFLDGGNFMYRDSNGQVVSLTNVSGIRNASNWQYVPATAIPEPTLLAPLLLLLAFLGLRGWQMPRPKAAILA